MENTKTASLEILHIEDDPLDARLIEDRLDTLGFPHHTTRIMTSEAFLGEIQKHKADVILSDSGLSTFNVFDALALVRRKYADVPFIFLSGNASPELQQKAREQGAFDYVVKDNLAQLPKTLRRACSALKPDRAAALLPPIFQRVIVRCPSFQCMAYLDREGTWRDFRNSLELPEVQTWYAP